MFACCKYSAVMAEWLRRWTRNPMGSSRAGSNPARSGWFFKYPQKASSPKHTAVTGWVFYKNRNILNENNTTAENRSLFIRIEHCFFLSTLTAKTSGDAGDRTRGLSHAKRTLYHWATSPGNDAGPIKVLRSILISIWLPFSGFEPCP